MDSFVAKLIKNSPAMWETWVSHSVVSNSLQPHGLLPARLLCPWDFPFTAF